MEPQHDSSTPPPPPAANWHQAPGQPAQPIHFVEVRRKSNFGRIVMSFFAMLLLLSVLMNVYLGLLLAARFDGGMDKKVVVKGKENQVVAVYAVDGILDSEAAGLFATFKREILESDNVKAVVLRVNSPGGAVAPSDQIYEMVQEIRESGRKVVVSMGGYAASGGYYISCPADYIYAEHTTVTGSIGVIAEWPVIGGALDKIGMKMMVLKSDDAQVWKDAPSIIDEPTPRQREHLVNTLNSIQERFNSVVTAGRGAKLKTEQRTLTVGSGAEQRQITETIPLNGKTYLAAEAKEVGLIDEIGYLGQAQDKAGSLAGLANPKVVIYSSHEGILERLAGTGLNSGAPLGLTRDAIDEIRTPKIMLIWRGD